MLRGVREIIDPWDIDYVVVNYPGVDHSSALPKIMNEANNAEIISEIPKSIPRKKYFMIEDLMEDIAKYMRFPSQNWICFCGMQKPEGCLNYFSFYLYI
ncbi:MAG: hypothetical protein A7316_05745 [Candidatus Altiarchaeales archaeon WOR_SM1_86-2]|nr:MAG: hypothetical protein A7316_05745 [Candidatus Altiarchaeales archaeon WOR_SM1_86-2]